MNLEYGLMMDPNEVITFKFIENTNLNSNVHLKNTSDHNLAFKIRTTEPKSYYVRPNQGVLMPGDHKEINIIMQASPVRPEFVSHKFLVQSAATLLNSSCGTAEISKFWEMPPKSTLVNSAKLLVKILEESSEELYYKPTQKEKIIENKPIPVLGSKAHKYSKGYFAIVSAFLMVLGATIYVIIC
jgi:MSP (Major sperm protein) domain